MSAKVFQEGAVLLTTTEAQAILDAASGEEVDMNAFDRAEEKLRTLASSPDSEGGVEDIEEQLRAAGARRREAELNRLITAGYLRDTVRKADSAGWAKTRIAEVAGISRQTVHEMLRD